MAKILIIEDDLIMIRFYRKLFALEGHLIEAAEGGREGLKQVKTFKPDLILLDIMMPKMHGLEVLGRLKAKPETKDIPVVILTNLAGQADARVGLSKGAVKYLVKSKYEPKEVVEIIEEVLASHSKKETPSPEKSSEIKKS